MRVPVFLALIPASALVLTGLSASTSAQSASTRERTLFVSALTEQGAPIDTLAPADVVVREDGVRREVLRVTRATEPMDIAVLVDNSEAASSAVIELRRSIATFVARIAGQEGARNNVALIGLAARPTVLVDYTTETPRLQQAIGRLFPQNDSGTTLLDALTEVSNGLSRREATRAAIVAIVTDGIEFTNKDATIVIDALRRAGVAFHAVAIGRFPIRNDEDRERARVLGEGTRLTGGHQHTLLTPMGLDVALDAVARELTSQHKVVYGRPESLIPPDRTDVSAARPGLTVRGTAARGQGV
jgi:hypothetical protein